jgi:hypothetical protein
VSGKEDFKDQANALLVQQHQVDCAERKLGEIHSALGKTQSELQFNDELLNSLIAQAESSLEACGVAIEIDEVDCGLVECDIFASAAVESIPYREIAPLDYIKPEELGDWNSYLAQVESYAGRHDIRLDGDPYDKLMSPTQRIALEKRIKDEFTVKGANCDKYDYMIAGTCGLIGGLIDVVFVGVAGSGALTGFTDATTDAAVEKFAKICGWEGAREGKNPTKSAIGFLERSFSVNYDHRHGGDVDRKFDMSTKNHHIKNLGHSPDLVGLFFSILDQFNSTAHFIDSGRIIVIDTENFELRGSSFVAKLFCGFVNWLGHLFSDVAGSSGAINRGSGIPIPFFSLLQFINVGEFGQHRQTFAKIAVQVFEQGYDLRHGLAMAIPVMVTELLTRICWVAKRHCYHQYPWSECIPTASNPELRRMLLVAHGSLCLVDTTDAALRSGGNMIQFMLRVNLIGWVRFGSVALKEVQTWYWQGTIDEDAVDSYLDAEYRRMLAT